ncbi:MAG: hypothetical protein Fur002_21920 [Anaerolineales bacterium]
MRSTLRLALILTTIIILLSACTTSRAFSSGESGACDNPLFPIKQGAIWSYASAGGPNGSFSYSDSIASVNADGFTLASKFSDGQTHIQEWRCLSDGLQALQIGGASAAGISTQGMTADFTVIEAQGLSLPREITPGMKWQYSMTMKGVLATPDNQKSPSSGSYLAELQEMGSDTVTVPAGVFEATRFQANSNVDVTMNFEGLQVPVKYTGVTILWYAPGVGFIKSIENGDFGGTAFAITTELQSYNIP